GGPGNLITVNGTMKKEQYIKILNNNIRQSAEKLGLGHQWTFQHDNDPKQTAKVVKKWELKIRVMARRPSNLKELELIAKDEWAKIPVETCKKLEYTTSVTSYISKCIDDVTVSKTITTCSNQKPWMTAEVRALLKSRDSAFRAGDKEALRTARAKLSRATATFKTAETPGAYALNDFYTWFEAQNNVAVRKTIPPPNDKVLCLSTADMKRTLCRVNPQKSAGPDNIPGTVLRECAEQLADVFTDIFNISLSSVIVPTCLKTMTIVPVPKNSTVSCLNDYCPAALTLIMMKCFKRLVMRHIKTQLPPSLDPLQFAYRPNHSTDNAITTTLHLSLTHLDNKDTYV
ncbi:hypothetical protein QTP86_019810, partial [Hemibagrus guttatus]